MASKQSTEAVQQRMMQFMHRNGGAASTATTAAAPTSATEDTQNSPQGKYNALGNNGPLSRKNTQQLVIKTLSFIGKIRKKFAEN